MLSEMNYCLSVILHLNNWILAGGFPVAAEAVLNAAVVCLFVSVLIWTLNKAKDNHLLAHGLSLV